MALKKFANPGVQLQSWYPVFRSSALRGRGPKTVELLGRRVVFFRGEDARLRALDADCPHLGADLGAGELKGDTLRCGFHGWCFDASGACVDSPPLKKPLARYTRAYPVEEALGWAWVFNGPKALFELPCKALASEGRAWLVAKMRQPHHSHVLAANGLDLQHFRSVHKLDLLGEPVMETPTPWSTRLLVTARPRSKALQWLTGSGVSGVASTFTTYGGNMALATVEKPLRFMNFFAGRSRPDGSTDWLIFMVAPPGNGWRWAYGLSLTLALLPDDIPVLKGLRFKPNFGPQDRELITFARQIEAQPTW